MCLYTDAYVRTHRRVDGGGEAVTGRMRALGVAPAAEEEAPDEWGRGVLSMPVLLKCGLVYHQEETPHRLTQYLLTPPRLSCTLLLPNRPQIRPGILGLGVNL